MKNIVECPAEVKSNLPDEPQPLSLAWDTQAGTLPWETNVVDGLGNIVCTCPRLDLALYIRDTGNHFAECRDGLADARDLLLKVGRGAASLEDVAAMVRQLERLVFAAGGSF